MTELRVSYWDERDEPEFNPANANTISFYPKTQTLLFEVDNDVPYDWLLLQAITACVEWQREHGQHVERVKIHKIWIP